MCYQESDKNFTEQVKLPGYKVGLIGYKLVEDLGPVLGTKFYPLFTQDRYGIWVKLFWPPEEKLSFCLDKINIWRSDICRECCPEHLRTRGFHFFASLEECKRWAWANHAIGATVLKCSVVDIVNCGFVEIYRNTRLNAFRGTSFYVLERWSLASLS